MSMSADLRANYRAVMARDESVARWSRWLRRAMFGAFLPAVIGSWVLALSYTERPGPIGAGAALVITWCAAVTSAAGLVLCRVWMWLERLCGGYRGTLGLVMDGMDQLGRLPDAALRRAAREAVAVWPVHRACPGACCASEAIDPPPELVRLIEAIQGSG